MKAAHVAIDTMKGHLDAVYDVTVAYEGTLDSSRQRRSAPAMPGMQACCFRHESGGVLLLVLQLITCTFISVDGSCCCTGYALVCP